MFPTGERRLLSNDISHAIQGGERVPEDSVSGRRISEAENVCTLHKMVMVSYCPALYDIDIAYCIFHIVTMHYVAIPM